MWTFFSINTVSPSHLVFNCEYKTVHLTHSGESKVGNVKIPFSMHGWSNPEMGKATLVSRLMCEFSTWQESKPLTSAVQGSTVSYFYTTGSTGLFTPASPQACE